MSLQCSQIPKFGMTLHQLCPLLLYLLVIGRCNIIVEFAVCAVLQFSASHVSLNLSHRASIYQKDTSLVTTINANISFSFSTLSCDCKCSHDNVLEFISQTATLFQTNMVAENEVLPQFV